MALFWHPAATRVYAHTFDPFGVNVYALTSSSGTLVVDSGNNPAQGLEILSNTPETHAVVNTHAHYDHAFGNFAFASQEIPIIAHHEFIQHQADHAMRQLEAYKSGTLEDGISAGLWDDVVPTTVDLPLTGTVESRLIHQLAGFERELTFHALRAAHTTSDLIIHDLEANVWFTGDLVETSGPPSIETDSDIAGWIDALDYMLDQSSNDTVFLPGHGPAATMREVMTQRGLLAQKRT